MQRANKYANAYNNPSTPTYVSLLEFEFHRSDQLKQQKSKKSHTEMFLW